jgi:hypothetical protein
LFGVGPRDAVTYAIVAAIIALGGLAACLVPARQAVRVEPGVTLRGQ